MRVTDAQVHIWEAQLSDRPTGNFPLSRLEQAMKDADVDRVVLVPFSKAVDGATKEANEYPIAAAGAQPNRFAVVGLVELGRPDSGKNLVDLLQQPGVKGIRVQLRDETPETIDWIAAQAVRGNFPLSVLANRDVFDRLAHLVDNHPDVTILLDHASAPATEANPFGHFDKVLALVKHKNLIVKCSSMTRWSKEEYPFRDLHTYIRRLRDAFGPERLAWGSDLSWVAARHSYRQTIDLFREACDFLGPSDLEWMLDKTLSRALRWD